MKELTLNNNRERRHYWEFSIGQFSASTIDTALRALKPEMGEILDLHYRKGYSLLQISTMMGRSISQIRNYHNRGIYRIYRFFNPRPLPSSI